MEPRACSTYSTAFQAGSCSPTRVSFWLYPVEGMICETVWEMSSEHVLPEPDGYILHIQCGTFILPG